jgi:hypothetical protein
VSHHLRATRRRAAWSALVVLAAVTWFVVQGSSPASGDVAITDLEALGGRAWRTCALAVGLVLGGALGMPANPLGGATAISLGLHLGLFSCT